MSEKVTNTAGYEAQEKYCNEYELPIFIQKDGTCPRCGRNIFSDGGFSIEHAGRHLITGCPFCNASYCE